MRINLEVPFKQKDKAKSLGAKWDGVKNCWYIVDKDDLEPFMQWIPKIMKKEGVHKRSNEKNSLFETENSLLRNFCRKASKKKDPFKRNVSVYVQASEFLASIGFSKPPFMTEKEHCQKSLEHIKKYLDA